MHSNLITEKQNPHSMDIDTLSTLEILELINKEDSLIPSAVQKAISEIEKVVEFAVTALKNGNRIIYIGAGTSGRLGILDASEIPPTFSAPHEWFTGVIAGGTEAVFKSIEGAEDIWQNAERDLNAIGMKKGDVLIGIASSSTTPYVIAGLKYGKQIGCRTAFLICNPIPVKSESFDAIISVDLGPEIITGSTRMKAGTATKLILNMISTTAMVKMGKVYGNLMVDLRVVNEKLRDRGTRIIGKLTDLNYQEAGKVLQESGGSVKTALIMVNKSCSKREAKELIEQYDGNLRQIIGDIDIDIDEHAKRTEVIQKIGKQYKKDKLTDATGFLEKARHHQSEYRAFILNVPCDEYGNYLTKEDASVGLNFYPDFNIFQEVKKRYKNYSKALYANMLRSEHIGFNLFIPFKTNPDFGKNVFNNFLSNQIQSIDKIKIEYAPSPAEKYLDDRTSFDTYIEYTHIDNHKGIIGIEVKYTEHEYKLKTGSKEEKDINNESSRYYIVSEKSQLYKPETLSLLKADKYRQVWRNQLLGESILIEDNDKFKHFTSLTIFPKGNLHFVETSKEYMEMLTSHSDRFVSITYEDFILTCKKYCTNDKYIKWINYLEDRYIIQNKK